MSTEAIETGLGDHISQTVAALMTSEFIEKEVNARLQKMVVESVDRALRSYSDTGKLIEKAVEEALRVDRIDLPSYGHVVSQILKTQIQAQVSDLVAGKLAEDMNELLSLAPKEIKLSDITNEMLQKHKDDGSYGEVITCIVEKSPYGGWWIYLDEDEVIEERNKHQCEHRLGVNEDGKIFSAVVGNMDLKKSKQIGRFYGVEQKLRAYVACGTKLIVDEDFVSTGVGDY